MSVLGSWHVLAAKEEGVTPALVVRSPSESATRWLTSPVWGCHFILCFH